jgi:2',3'-cyclic-nucleotide 2'-phosphodiesterase (5'-nucleotidase family)
MPTFRQLSVLVFSLSAAAGCVEYNEECSRFMTDPEGIAGYLGGDVTITKTKVRTDDNSVGQLVAEAYYAAFDDQPSQYWPDLAVVNSGAIRFEGVCESREILKKGPVKRKVLRDVLPFDNRVVVVSVTHRQLKGILEHGVAGYSAIDPKGSFLQLAGAEIRVNCSLPSETIASDGTRATEGQRVVSVAIQHRPCEVAPSDPQCGQTVEIPLDPPSDTLKVRIATDSFLQSGGDNFLDFKSVDPNAADTVSAGSFNFEIVARYFQQAYPSTAPLAAEAADRVMLQECR